jgi:membrane-associated protein
LRGKALLVVYRSTLPGERVPAVTRFWQARKETRGMLSLGGAHLAALNPLSSTSVLASLGALGVFLALFAETGLLIGFFLPGDSLLFTAGLLCTTGSHSVHLSLPVVILAAIGGALLGAETGYFIGRSGRPLVGRSNNRFVRDGTERAAQLLERYGYG